MPDAVCRLAYSPQEIFPDVGSIETSFGRKFVGTRKNLNADDDMASVDNDVAAGYQRAFRNTNAQKLVTGVKTPMLWSDFTAGTYDASVITPLGTAILNDTNFSAAKPLYYSIHHEQTINTVSQKGYTSDVAGNPGCNTDATPAVATQQYIDFVRHWRVAWDTQGVSMFHRNGTYIGGPVVYWQVFFEGMFLNPQAGLTPDDFDPNKGSSPAPAGTSYYNGVGMDAYNTILNGHLKYGTNAATLLDPIVAFARARNMDFILPEFGCEDDLGGTTISTEKGLWLNSVCDYLVALGDRSPVCRYLGLTTGQSSGSNYYPASSPQSLAAFQRIASHPYFGLDLPFPYPVKTYTATFAAKGPVGQISFTLNARPSSKRITAVARRALHDTADNAPISISG
jgi:hypothetical protein